MGKRGPKPDPARAAARERLAALSDKSFTTLWNAKQRLDYLQYIGVITRERRLVVESWLVPIPGRRPSIRRYGLEAKKLYEQAQRENPEKFTG